MWFDCIMNAPLLPSHCGFFFVFGCRIFLFGRFQSFLSMLFQQLVVILLFLWEEVSSSPSTQPSCLQSLGNFWWIFDNWSRIHREDPKEKIKRLDDLPERLVLCNMKLHTSLAQDPQKVKKEFWQDLKELQVQVLPGAHNTSNYRLSLTHCLGPCTTSKFKSKLCTLCSMFVKWTLFPYWVNEQSHVLI